jgi:predicted transcriptional regulator
LHQFIPFKKSENIKFNSFVKVPRELLNSKEYETLNPNAILLFSLLADRLELSYKQNDKKIHFYDKNNEMYVKMKRDEAMKKLHLGRTALESALKLLEDCNLIKQKNQGANAGYIIYVGKTGEIIEEEKVIKISGVQNQQLPLHEINTCNCTKSTVDNNYNNIYINNKYNSKDTKKNFNNYHQREYSEDYLNSLYANVK